MIHIKYTSHILSQYYQYSHSRPNTRNQKTTRSFITYYTTSIHAMCSLIVTVTQNSIISELSSRDYISLLYTFHNFFSWDGVRHSPLGTLASNQPTVPTLDYRWVWSIRWNENWQEKPRYSVETCPSATLSTINAV
jgi:hypothetical protein